MNRSTTSLEEKENRRAKLMYELYDATDGNPLLLVSVGELKQQLGWSTSTMVDVCDFLIAARLVDIPNRGPTDIPEHYITESIKHERIGLTAAGVLEVEAALKTPNEPTEHLPPIMNVFHGSVGNVQQQVGTVDSTQVVHGSVSILDQREVVNRYLHEYREVLENLSASDHAIASAELTTAEAHINSPKPNEGALREALRSLRSIAEGMAGNAAFMGIVEVGKQLHL